MSYNVVFVGNNNSLMEQLDKLNINSTITTTKELLLEHLKTNYKTVHLLIISLENDMDSFNTILSLHTKYLYKDIPFIIVGNKQQILNGLALGAYDYIITPCSQEEFSSRLSLTLESLSCSTLYKKDKIANIQMTFQEYLFSEIKRAERGIYDLSIVFFSIVPKELTFDSDDRTICLLINQLSKLVHSRLRSTDTVVQYGTLTIVSFLPFTSSFNAEAVTDKIEKLYLNNLPHWITNKDQYQLVYSIVSYPSDGDNPEDLLFNAEKILEKNIASITI
ncbi:hypothetical protein EDC18_1075 [Natranaerovirga pectinivora]|uniref:Stage 0 sporulation protein A homolog n=1 Tax=Natranaerovirga pectinivora TaxID=682400 RepID=A0A4R3MID2_9FIRM|nr:hypothetical protein [Natranaerovirga pectinivora]TCT13937.1 hypothetical protein EDC18_1075 [Natranaerovirga pectinivora]